MNVCASCTCLLWKSDEGITNHGELPCGYRELNLDPLQAQSLSHLSSPMNGMFKSYFGVGNIVVLLFGGSGIFETFPLVAEASLKVSLLEYWTYTPPHLAYVVSYNNLSILLSSKV